MAIFVIACADRFELYGGIYDEPLRTMKPYESGPTPNKTAQQLNRLIDRQFFPDPYTRLEEKRKILKCIDELNSQPRKNAAKKQPKYLSNRPYIR